MPDIVKIAGDHVLIYEAYYRQLDPKESNAIGAGDAARFLKKSGLSDVVLSRIWDLSDPNGTGHLTKEGFFVALKLIGLAQEGLEINLKNIGNELSKPPRVGDLPKVPAQIKLLPTESTDWSMKPEKRQQYEQLFESLGPMNGLLSGVKVRATLMNSKLPVDTLGRIWDLADQDRDGSLDKHEFCVAMHLVYEALDKRAIPAMLPPQLQRQRTPPQNGNGFDAFGSGGGGDGGFVANFPTDIAPPPVVPPLPAVNRAPPVIPPAPNVAPLVPIQDVGGVSSASGWVVTPLERCKFEEIFNKSDSDRDGLVSGLEIKDVFLQSGLPQPVLAHIWALCDTNQSGKLKLEEFCLAMWFVERAKKGIEPPQALAPNMIPPSFRKGSIVQEPPQPTYSNPELEMISKEIEELAKERRLLEQEVAQKEADVRIKSGELRSLQSELDTLTATLKQLENQKGEAQKRLDDLKNQKVDVDQALCAVVQDIGSARVQVTKIREQCQKQEVTLKEQEGELDSRRSELQKLKDEEHALEKEYNSCTKEVDRLTSQLQDTQLEISQVKAMVTQIQEYKRKMTDALSLIRSAVDTNDPIMVSDYSLKIEPEFREAKRALEEKEVENANKRDPFGDNKAANGFDGGNAETGFEDEFKTNGFATQFDTANGFQGSGFGDDGFGSQPFGGGGGGGGGFDNMKSSADPFGSSAVDPFAEQKGAMEPAKDEFGCDPFAILHAPTSSHALTPSPSKSVAPPRPESPSPALPPKKAKQPPPRPAPPRPMQGPTPTKPAPPASDVFGDSSGGGSFANFADFDNKNLKPAATAPATTPFGIGDPFGKVGNYSSSSASATMTTTPVTTTATPTIVETIATPTGSDFVEDPFKDYRYEDPFNIADPFADDDSSPSDDTFTSYSNVTNSNVIGGNNALNNNSTGNVNKSPHNSVEELDDLFGDKSNKINNNNNASTAFNTMLNNSKNNSATINSNGGETTRKKLTAADPFDAFNDNFSKNTNSNLSNQDDLFKAFGGDNGGAGLAFGDVAFGGSATGGANVAFGNAFAATTTTTRTVSSASSTKSFEDEFSKMDDVFSKLDFSNNNNNNNFANFAPPTAAARYGQNVKAPSNVSNGGSLKKQGDNTLATPPPPVPKFSADYSKGETFDADLQTILQRSMVDK